MITKDEYKADLRKYMEVVEEKKGFEIAAGVWSILERILDNEPASAIARSNQWCSICYIRDLAESMRADMAG